ncbi:MAG TPA: class I SAM-dependent methyltransferase [Thermomicrobiales bacterium]|nr:class I SAM-dependent methyltransferase [Thermomicrobiales bacterium]
MQATPKREIRRSDEHYTPIAADYTTSTIHSQGDDLGRLVPLSGVAPGARLLDVGAGTGHAGLAFQSLGVEIVALDMTAAMLSQARNLARSRGATLDPLLGMAESLPLQSATFDAVVCRYCAHHFMDVERAVNEWRRVLRPGGPLLFVDHVAPEEDEADEFVNRLDWLRDPSHHREPKLSEYRRWFATAGLAIDSIEHFRETMTVEPWFQRARTAPDRQAEARAMLAGASSDLRATFSIVDDPLAFDLHMVLIRATAT